MSSDEPRPALRTLAAAYMRLGLALTRYGAGLYEAALIGPDDEVEHMLAEARELGEELGSGAK